MNTQMISSICIALVGILLIILSILFADIDYFNLCVILKNEVIF